MSIIYDELFIDSFKQATSTYSILSFQQYIIAELYAIFNKGLSIRQCEDCGQFIISGQKLSPQRRHICPEANHSENSEMIRKIYRKKGASINTHISKKEWDLMYDAPLTIHPAFMERAEKLKKHLKSTFQQALFTQMPYEDYDRYISQEHLSIRKLNASSERLAKINAAQEGRSYSQLIKEKAIYYTEFRLPVLGEIITPKEVEEMIKEYEQMDFSDSLGLEAIVSRVTKKMNMQEQQEDSSASADSAPDDNVTQ